MRRETNRTEQNRTEGVKHREFHRRFVFKKREEEEEETRENTERRNSFRFRSLLESSWRKTSTSVHLRERKKRPGKLLLLSSLLLGGFALFFLKRREIERRKFADLLRDADALCSPRCRLVGGEFDPGSERDGTHRPGGEVFGGVWLQPDLGPHGHRTRHLRALRQREGGVFRSPEHQPWAVRDEQPNHGYLLRPGRKFKILSSIFGMKCLVLIGKKCVFLPEGLGFDLRTEISLVQTLNLSSSVGTTRIRTKTVFTGSTWRK